MKLPDVPWRWLTLGLALVLTSISLAAGGGLRRYAQLRQQLMDLDEKNQALRADNQRLIEEIAALRTDPWAIEQAAREALGFVRPGETVFLLQD